MCEGKKGFQKNRTYIASIGNSFGHLSVFAFWSVACGVLVLFPELWEFSAGQASQDTQQLTRLNDSEATEL